MALFLLSIFLYGFPIIMLVYMALEIYFRNKANPLNRITALLLLMLTFLIFGLFFSKLLPDEYIVSLTFYIKYVPMFIVMSIALHFFSLLTSRFVKIPSYLLLSICYAPLLAIIILIYQQTWIKSEFVIKGYWKYEYPSEMLVGISFLVAFYTIVVGSCFLVLGLRHVSQKEHLAKKKKQIQFILLGLLLAGSWAFSGNFIPHLDVGIGQLNYPEFSAFGIVIFAFIVRVAMTRYAFLPSFEHKYQILHELSSLSIILLDHDLVIQDVNPAALKLFGLKASEIRRRTFNSLLIQPEHEGNDFSGEYAIIQANQERRLVYAESKSLLFNEENYQYIILEDITERRAAEQRIAFLAYKDELTGLLNRVKFQEVVADALECVHIENENQTAVIIIDLDRFKMINESKGRHVGNLFLKQAADFLSEQASQYLKVARIGSDEFALLLTDYTDDEHLDRLLKTILEHFRMPYIFENTPFFIAVSIGVSFASPYGNTAEELLKNAGIAMNHAKNNGGDRYQRYAKDIKHPDLERHVMENRMRKALELGEFVLHYQPQIDMNRGTITGVEALIRWNSPDLGLVSPGEFIPLAEKSGLIIPIGHWVLQQACKDRKSWFAQGIEELTVSVNISLFQFKNENFIEELKLILFETKLDPRLLCLEITESTAMENQAYTMKVCDELVGLGIILSIDDFGTGYSSFSLLKSLKFKEIKIDRYFIQGIVDNPYDHMIIKAIIAMAHGLKLKVVAEGVEDVEQLEILKDMLCDQIQGFYISKALAESELILFLQG
ncbi:EAL domain-containing protein [Paenibacillus psychroresistens]|uniref:EAL domain-containing protein n=1 Tax=Paenibacillus psychroresistens TaxID=1778678 RepID=A0A6B8RRX6_9BACL|nr:EAL domain-containing protein [Paenibacillus psychroresistens]QGQ98233.1 EAL domain-containing protein [Paenibacillus psychroresistens]